MVQRRKFIFATVSLIGLSALAPFISLQAFAREQNLSTAEQDRFKPLRNKWLAPYDTYGNYLTDIKLLKSYDEGSDARLEQFSLVWETEGSDRLAAGMYVIDDFATSPMKIYLEPSQGRVQGKYYRAAFSLLRE